MKILVTGASGFIGTHLCEYLKAKHELHVLCRKSTSLDKILVENYVVFEDDIIGLQKYIADHEIEGVIHLATYYTAEHKPEDVSKLVASNIFMGTAVLDAAVRAGVKWFLNVGTIWQNFNAGDRTDKYCPVNLYAASKQAFLTMAEYYKEVSNIRFSTLKLCDTFGPNDPRRKIMALFHEIAESQIALDMSSGTQMMDIVHVDKVVHGIEVLMQRLADETLPYRSEYVVTSNNVKTLREIAADFEMTNNVKLNINWGARSHRAREVFKPYVGFDIFEEV